MTLQTQIFKKIAMTFQPFCLQGVIQAWPWEKVNVMGIIFTSQQEWKYFTCLLFYYTIVSNLLKAFPLTRKISITIRIFILDQTLLVLEALYLSGTLSNGDLQVMWLPLTWSLSQSTWFLKASPELLFCDMFGHWSLFWGWTQRSWPSLLWRCQVPLWDSATSLAPFRLQPYHSSNFRRHFQNLSLPGCSSDPLQILPFI